MLFVLFFVWKKLLLTKYVTVRSCRNRNLTVAGKHVVWLPINKFIVINRNCKSNPYSLLKLYCNNNKNEIIFYIWSYVVVKTIIILSWVNLHIQGRLAMVYMTFTHRLSPDSDSTLEGLHYEKSRCTLLNGKSPWLSRRGKDQTWRILQEYHNTNDLNQL